MSGTIESRAGWGSDLGRDERDADIEAIRKDVAAVNIRMATMMGDMNHVKWMLGTTLATVVMVLFRVFTH